MNDKDYHNKLIFMVPQTTIFPEMLAWDYYIVLDQSILLKRIRIERI